MSSLFRSNFGFALDEIVEHARILGLETDEESLLTNHKLINFSIVIDVLNQLSASGIDWGVHHGRPDIPPEVWSHRVDLSFTAASNHHRHGEACHPAALDIGGLLELMANPWPQSAKADRAIVLAKLSGIRRVIDPSKGGVEAVSGLSLDDDGVIGRSAYDLRYLTIVVSTASDGKSSELVPVEAYRSFAKKNGRPKVPSSSDISDYLNQNSRHGEAYRNVELVRDFTELRSLCVVENAKGYNYATVFDKQDRSRVLVPFQRSLPAELVYELRSNQRGFQTFCERVELAVFGRHGTDRSCFDPVRLGYLPIQNDDLFCKVMGPPLLIDAIAIAERVLADAPPPPMRAFSVMPMLSVPEGLRQSLRGVRLASLISDLYPNLVHNENNLAPIILRRCPFCEAHGSRRGQADNTLYCFDPDQTPYPVMRCRHQTCADRKTEEFVAAMIELNELVHDDVFNNAEYREQYVEQRPALGSTPLTSSMRNVIKS